MPALNRRSFAATAAGALLGGCAHRAQTETTQVRLRSKPGEQARTAKPGVHTLRLRSERDAILYVPESAPKEGPASLIVFLHGAGGNEQRGLRFMTPYADAFGVVVLVPASEGGTWDAIQGSYGPDVRFIDRALEATFNMCRLDPATLAVSGFSDGASYALGLGLSNGDLFRHVLAFSPGFVPSGAQPNGRPRFFVSHGTGDRILPIEQCSRRIVPRLKQSGYDVTFREFDGPHTLPRDVGDAAMRWLLG
jgi:phospholipase/carboxylesterase